MVNVALIIPAYNEEDRIGRVLQAVGDSRVVNEIIVVSDGSTDHTASVALAYSKVRVVELAQNRGKGAAMDAGVLATPAQVVGFIDADLIGLTGRHIDDLFAPVVSGQCDMCLGVFRGGRLWSDVSQRLFPYISGQRAMTRQLFERLPNLEDKGFGAEIAIHDFLKLREEVVQQAVIWRGVSNYYKEQKLGWVEGLRARRRMYADMVSALRVQRPWTKTAKQAGFLNAFVSLSKPPNDGARGNR